MKRVKINIIMVAAFAGFIVSCSVDKESDSLENETELPVMGRTAYEGNDTIYHTIADFKFVDQDSNFVTNETFDGKIYVADFFFTSCPTICPVMKREMLRVYDVYKDDPEIGILSYSIDPKHDTVAVLKEFSDRLGVRSDKWHFVTGNKEDIYELGQKSYYTTTAEDKSEPGGFIHSGAFILVDKDRRIRGLYDGTKPEQVNKLIGDIKKLKKEYNG